MDLIEEGKACPDRIPGASHLQELIAIDDPWKRAFFENECLLAKN